MEGPTVVDRGLPTGLLCAYERLSRPRVQTEHDWVRFEPLRSAANADQPGLYHSLEVRMHPANTHSARFLTSHTYSILAALLGVSL